MSLGLPVRLDGVGFAYGEMRMSFDLSVGASEVVAIMGPSGSGKTTMLNLIAGFETPSEGRIVIGDRDVTAVPPAQRPVSMIFQENNLFAHLDVFANVALGRNPALRLTSGERTEVTDALRRVGLAGKEARRPGELSGGERQRAALARALVRRRPVLLMDEPFASLGPGLRAEMAELVGNLHRETGMTILVVTHSPEDALALAPRMVFIDAGRIAGDGATQDLLGHGGPEAVRAYVGARRSR
ncbi:MAG: thiamine ABC transporter ATP-binding protein [Mesorhizobium sp.]|nr:thiamine ABC transporter ATP-binding protein [Mesorhizobium sp.]MCO5161702.1 thiamine ABC transporter ATP-binding protein [Mesorhizobium sp.]